MKTYLLLALLLFGDLNAHAMDKSVLAAPVAVTVTGTSALAIAANQTRKYLLIQNNGSASIYVKAGAAHTGTEGIIIIAGGVWEPIVAPIDAIYLKASTGSQAVVVQEGN